MAPLTGYDFPGNVRRLSDMVERGVVLLANGCLREKEQLPDDLREPEVRAYRWQTGALPALEAQEAECIQWVLGQTGSNRTRATEIPGIDRTSRWRKLKKNGLEV